MATNNWDKVVSPKELLAYLQERPGSTMKETKEHFQCESRNVRHALGILMQHDKVFPMQFRSGVAWMLITGKRGRPNVMAARNSWLHEQYGDKIAETRAKNKTAKAEPDDDAPSEEEIEELKRKWEQAKRKNLGKKKPPSWEEPP